MFERFSKRARMAVVAAQEEARDNGADRITAVHLLLGVLETADGAFADELGGLGLTDDVVRLRAERIITDQDVEDLKGIGVDVAAIADVVSERFGFDILRPVRKRFRAGNIPFDPGAKKSLQLALREAVSRKDRTIDGAHVLLGVLRSDDPESVAAVESVVPRGELRRRLYDLLDRSAA
ncbi:Clp protease [Tsukamurella sputi]|uniref:Clp protease n=1 Tax=Tsukamurella sputi TaxID=2591848 RepID=A0A5C5RKL9_9ACTN|nr:Clp protease N-terminal domain-containing protein [Tsukamurella sputi]TWS23579.1 Clp protease [Tsukamurella sputi]